MESGGDDLPDGIIEDIVAKLPTKSVIRFKCVSKYWFNLIKSNLFVNKHLINSSDESYLGTFFTFPHTLSGEQRFIIMHMYDVCKETSDPHFQEGHNISPFLKFEFHLSYRIRIEFISQCNGITCSMIDYNTIVLINPILKEVKTIPMLRTYVKCLELVGFGFDNVSMDFKVVIICVLDKSANEYNHRHGRVEVYSLRRNDWRELNESPFLTDCSCEYGSTFFDGVLYWCARTEYLDWRILTFNMATELFHHFEYPQNWNNYGTDEPFVNDYIPSLFVINQDSLAFVSYCHHFYSRHYVNIWKMDKHGNDQVSWTKLYSFKHFPQMVTPICFLNNHELLYSSTALIHELILFNPLNHATRTINSNVVSQVRKAFNLQDYISIDMELCRSSLISLNT